MSDYWFTNEDAPQRPRLRASGRLYAPAWLPYAEQPAIPRANQRAPFAQRRLLRPPELRAEDRDPGVRSQALAELGRRGFAERQIAAHAADRSDTPAPVPLQEGLQEFTGLNAAREAGFARERGDYGEMFKQLLYSGLGIGQTAGTLAMADLPFEAGGGPGWGGRGPSRPLLRPPSARGAEQRVAYRGLTDRALLAELENGTPNAISASDAAPRGLLDSETPDGGASAPRQFATLDSQYGFAHQVADAVERDGGQFGDGLQLVLKTRTAGMDQRTPVFNVMRNGQKIGIVDLNADENGLRLHPTLDVAHRRQNIGTQLYRYLERMSGQPLSRSDNLTEAGAGLWGRLDRNAPARGGDAGGQGGTEWVDLYHGGNQEPGPWRGRMWATTDAPSASDYALNHAGGGAPNVQPLRGNVSGAVKIGSRADLAEALGSQRRLAEQPDLSLWQIMDDQRVQDALRANGVKVVNFTRDARPSDMRWHPSYLFLDESRVQPRFAQAPPNGGDVAVRPTSHATPDGGGAWMRHIQEQGADLEHPLYHGTPRGFSGDFDLERSGASHTVGGGERAVFFTDSPEAASAEFTGRSSVNDYKVPREQVAQLDTQIATMEDAIRRGPSMEEMRSGGVKTTADIEPFVQNWRRERRAEQQALEAQRRDSVGVKDHYPEGAAVIPSYARGPLLEIDMHGAGYNDAIVQRGLREARAQGMAGVRFNNMRDGGYMGTGRVQNVTAILDPKKNVFSRFGTPPQAPARGHGLLNGTDAAPSANYRDGYAETHIGADGRIVHTYQGSYQSGGGSQEEVAAALADGSSQEFRQSMRSALRALSDDIAMHHRPEYSWTAGPDGIGDPRLAEFYRRALQTHTPPGYVFSETDDGVMRLTRSDAAQSPRGLLDYESPSTRPGMDEGILGQGPRSGLPQRGLLGDGESLEQAGTRPARGRGYEAIIAEIEAAVARGEPITSAEIARRLQLDPESVITMRSQVRLGRLKPNLRARLEAAEDALGDVTADRRANAPLIQNLRRLADEGASLRQAAERLGIRYDRAQRVALRHGIAFPDMRAVSEHTERNLRWLADVEGGMTVRAIAARDGVGRGAVQSGVNMGRRARAAAGAAPVASETSTSATASRLGIPEERVRDISAARRKHDGSKADDDDSAKQRDIVFAHNQTYARPGPYVTPLDAGNEQMFRNWVQQNDVSFDPDEEHADYDMRGFWQALQRSDPRATSAVDRNDGLMHFPDTWKTPYHRSFSNESMYATENAPHWNERDQLIDNDGAVIYDERAQSPARKGLMD